MNLGFDVDQRLGHVDASGADINSRLAKAEEFAETQPAEPGEQHERSVSAIIASASVQSSSELRNRISWCSIFGNGSRATGLCVMSRSSTAALTLLLSTWTTLWIVAGANADPAGSPGEPSTDATPCGRVCRAGYCRASVARATGRTGRQRARVLGPTMRRVDSLLQGGCQGFDSPRLHVSSSQVTGGAPVWRVRRIRFQVHGLANAGRPERDPCGARRQLGFAWCVETSRCSPLQNWTG